MKRRIGYLLSIWLLLVSMLTGCAYFTYIPDVDLQVNDSMEETSEKDAHPTRTEETESSTLFETLEDESETSMQKGDEPASTEASTEATEAPIEETEAGVREDGSYTSKEEVAEYLYLFGHLPDNFITKNEAKALGWVSKEGNLWEVAPGKSIGGDYFGNYEGRLPEKQGRKYYECDIDFDGSYRGGKRIVFSNDGLIYYTDDHYESFELLYGEP